MSLTHYNGDDTLATLTDARGATTSYTYNNRRLVTGVTYGVPTSSSIPVPYGPTYTYDEAGNRTGMWDEFAHTTAKHVTYSYNQLSQLTSETRPIVDSATGIDESYTLDYTYSPSGQLASVNDPDDTTRKVTYDFDVLGQVTAIESNGFASTSTSLYAGDFTYRAHGAVKSMTYGSGKSLAASYDSRLQLAAYSVTDNIDSSYSFGNDGRLNLVTDNLDSRYDRSYTFDHVGRLVNARSGAEALSTSTTTVDRPYREDFGVNAFGNLTSRSGEVWDQAQNTMSGTYINNRRQESGFTYDADGRTTAGAGFDYDYDAAGRKYQTTSSYVYGRFTFPLNLKQDFDGDGHPMKLVEQHTVSIHPTTYQVS